MSKTIEQLAKEHLKSTKSNGLAITYSLDELEDFAKAYQAQNEQQEAGAPYEVRLSVISVKRGFEVDGGTFKTMDEAKAYAHREHSDRDDVICEYLELYTSPPKQAIPEGWISVKDKHPEQYAAVLVARFDGKYWTISKDAYQFGNNYAYDRDQNNVKVSHWMPLPEAPTTSLTSETNTEVGK